MPCQPMNMHTATTRQNPVKNAPPLLSSPSPHLHGLHWHHLFFCLYLYLPVPALHTCLPTPYPTSSHLSFAAALKMGCLVPPYLPRQQSAKRQNIWRSLGGDRHDMCARQNRHCFCVTDLVIVEARQEAIWDWRGKFCMHTPESSSDGTGFGNPPPLWAGTALHAQAGRQAFLLQACLSLQEGTSLSTKHELLLGRYRKSLPLLPQGGDSGTGAGAGSAACCWRLPPTFHVCAGRHL